MGHRAGRGCSRAAGSRTWSSKSPAFVALEGRASWAPVVAAVGLRGDCAAADGDSAIQRAALSAGCDERSASSGGHVLLIERRRELAISGPPVPIDFGAQGSALSVGSDTVLSLGPGGGRGGLCLGALGPVPPPGGGSGPACLGGGRGELDQGVHVPVPPPGGGLGSGGGWKLVRCPRCAGPSGACPPVAGRVAIKSGATGVGHWVLPGLSELHPAAWVTLCGWHFGISPHARCCACETSCKRCVLAAPCQDGVQGMAV